MNKKFYNSRYAFLEFGVAALLLIDWYFIKDSFGYLDINPNPYLILSVILSSFYGLRMAFVSVAVCSAAYLISLHLNLNYLEVETLFDFTYLATPIFMAISSVIIGELKQRSLDKIFALDQEIAVKEKSQDFLMHKESLHEQEISELKKRLVSKLDTVRSFYEIATSFHSVEEEELLKNFIVALKRSLKTEKIVIYKVHEAGQHIRLAAQSDGYHFPLEIHFSDLDALSKASLTHKKLSTIQDVFQDKNIQTKETVLISLPLMIEEQLEYLVSIYEVPFLEYIPSNFKIIDLYGKWLSSSLVYGRIYHHSMSNNVRNEQLQIYHYKYFKDHIDDEFLRAKTFKLPLTVLQLSLKNTGDMSESKVFHIKRIVCGLLTHMVRSLDYVCEGKNDEDFYIVFPVADAKIVQEILQKVVGEFKKLNIQGDHAQVELVSKVVEWNPSMQTTQEFAGEFL